MKINSKKYVNFVPRQPHWLSNRKGYYTMERNERVDDFSKKLMSNIKKELTSFDLRTYPDTDKIYKEVASWQQIKPEQLILHEGADGGLLRVFEVFITGKDKVITCEPSFAMYPVYCQMFGAIYHPLKLKVENYDYFNDLKTKIKKIKPKLIALANPNQPIEVILNLKQISEICEMARKYNSLVIIDEAYYHFNNITAKKLINKFDNLIVVRTFSKAFGLAGMRVGYTMANKKIIGYMMSIKPIYEINAFNIKLIRLFLKNINEMKNYTKAVKKGTLRLKNYLAKHGIKMYGKYSNTVLFRLKDYPKVKRVTKFLYDKKFIVRPMVIDGDNRFLRVTIGSEKIMGKFIKVLEKSFEKYGQ
tara:strand:+ start:4285 stop:5364 length:1080 start_codon:yes stop_codon:yes gene_type:complete